MNIKITADELRRALKDLDQAEEHGFMYCEAVLEISPTPGDQYWFNAKYDDLLEKAHPTDGKLNWGRGQDVTKNNYFKDGKLVPTDEEKERRENFPSSMAIEGGIINGYQYWIVDGSNRFKDRTLAGMNGYVAFPKRPVTETGYKGIMTYVPVHGGITFASETKFGMVYGFDTAHSDSDKYPRMDRAWIKKQCAKMIDGILMAQKVEKKYLAAKSQKEKAKYAQMVIDTDKEKENTYNFRMGINMLSGDL